RLRIDQPVADFGSPAQPGIHRLVLVIRVAEVHQRVIRIESRNGGLELVVGEPRSRRGRDDGLWCRGAIELVTVDEYAARHADHEHIDAESDSGPKVYLEERAAQPDLLRLPEPSLPHVHFSEAAHKRDAMPGAPECQIMSMS